MTVASILGTLQVSAGFDVADNEIVKRAAPGSTQGDRNAFASYFNNWLARRAAA